MYRNSVPGESQGDTTLRPAAVPRQDHRVDPRHGQDSFARFWAAGDGETRNPMTSDDHSADGALDLGRTHRAAAQGRTLRRGDGGRGAHRRSGRGAGRKKWLFVPIAAMAAALTGGIAAAATGFGGIQFKVASPVTVQALGVDVSNAAVGQTVTAGAKVVAERQTTLSEVALAVKAPDGTRVDFPHAYQWTLGTSQKTFIRSRAFSRAGTYTYWFTYKKDGHWIRRNPRQTFTVGTPSTPTSGPSTPGSTPRAGTSAGASGSPSPTSSPTVTASPTVPAPPMPTQPPAGFPDSTNTGYQNAPGYPGSLTKWSGTLQSNHTYSFIEFPPGTSINNLSNVTFVGCRFDGLESASFANVGIVGGNRITFSYDTFAPKNLTAPPVAFNQSSQWGIWENPTNPPTQLSIDHSDFWGFGNAVGFIGNAGSSTNWFVAKDNYFHDARADGGTDHTDGILNNVNNPSSGQYIDIEHNTFVSAGNTNGLALQDTKGDQHVRVLNNYFSGWGYSVQIGGPPNQDVVFEGNVFGTDLAPVWGPLYAWYPGPGNLWRGNTIHYVPGTRVSLRGHVITAADDGKFWLPDGTISATDFTG